MAAAPTVRPGLLPDALAGAQQDQLASNPQNAALNQMIQQLPSFQAFVQAMSRTGASGAGTGGSPEYKAFIADLQRLGINIPENEIVDSQTGIVRGRTWTERHPVLSGVLITAGFAGGSLAAGALLGAGAGAGAGGVGVGETAATTGLASGAGLPGAVAIPTVGDLALAGGSAIPGIGAAAGGAGGTLGTIGNTLANSGGTIGKISDILGAAGAGVSGATQAAGSTQLQNALMGLTANGENISGNSAFENELMKRAAEEGTQRSSALKDVYRQGIATHPNVSPFNPTGGPQYSPDYLSTLGSLKTQGVDTLSSPAQYSTKKLPPLKPYTDYNPNTISGAGGTEPSTMQTIGNWLGPSLSTISAIAKLLK